MSARRRALGGIVAVSGAESVLERGPALRAPQSRRSLRLSAGGAGGERERSVPVSAASPPLPQATRCEERRCTSCGFCSARGSGSAPALAAHCGWTQAGLGEWAHRCQGIGSSGKRSRAGLRSLREAPLLEETDVNFVPEATLSGFASAQGSGTCLPQSVPLGLLAAREPLALCDRNVLPSACFILPSPRLPREQRAGDEELLAADTGGWGRRVRRAPCATSGDPSLATALSLGRLCMNTFRSP